MEPFMELSRFNRLPSRGPAGGADEGGKPERQGTRLFPATGPDTALELVD
jgi:hypothetical protein